MSVEVRLRGIAQVEYEEAVAWYEERRSGLVFRFAAAIDATLEAIGEQPDRYAETGQAFARPLLISGLIAYTRRTTATRWRSRCILRPAILKLGNAVLKVSTEKQALRKEYHEQRKRQNPSPG